MTILQQKPGICEIGTVTLAPYGGKSDLAELVRATGYTGYVDSDITPQYFTPTVIGPLDEEVEYVLVRADGKPTSEELLAWTKANNCERPTAGDALRFWIQLPKEKQKGSLFFLHETVFTPPTFYGCVLCLRTSYSGVWILGLAWANSEWDPDDVFVFVRKRKKLASAPAQSSFP